jgi:parallel beta-helix repeat protein
MKRAVSAIVLSICLFNVFLLTVVVEPVNASETIYIRADGSVDPPTAPIQRDGDIYILTNNINESVVFERDNITFDGNGYFINGTETGRGIVLESRNNVTIKNTNIMAFQYGVWLNSSSYNTIVGNNITANTDAGISIDYDYPQPQGSSYNNIVDNNIANNGVGIDFSWPSNHNNISNNRITANEWNGISLYDSDHNILYGNNVTGNGYSGIYLNGSPDTTLRNNSMARNKYNFMVIAWTLELYQNDIDLLLDQQA